MPLLNDQVYYNATDAFQMDPALRELLRSTMDQASVDTEAGLTPAPGIPGGPAPGAMPQQVAPEKTDRLMPGAQDAFDSMPQLPARTLPISPEQLAMLDQLKPFGVPGAPAPRPMAPQAGPQVSAAAPQYGPGGPAPINPRAPVVGAPTPIPGGRQLAPAAGTRSGQIPDASRGNSVAAFLSGLGSSDAILPALGGGMQAVQQLEQQNMARNQTLRALINRGLDHETALAAVSNPEILKAVLPTLFGADTGRIEEIYDENGLPQKVMVGKNGAMRPIGGPKRDQNVTALSKGQMSANLKRTETYKSNADQARTTLSQLGQLETLRKDVDYEGIPFAPAVAQFMSWSGLGSGGAGASLGSNAATLQLGFTSLTKGAISDREMALFASATPGIQMADSAAGNVIAGMKAGAKRVIEQSKFFENWINANSGSLEGAQEAWDAYVAANPIIEPGPEGKGIRVNEKNVGNWKDYVQAGNTPRGAVPAAAPAARPTGGAAAPTGRPMPDGSLATSPHDTGEAVPGMMQLKDGTWVVPDPKSPTGYKRWTP